MRRFLLLALPLALLLTTPAHARPLDPRLANLNDWLYVLQPSGAASLAAIQASAFDGVVIDYSSDGTGATQFTPAEIAALKASGKVVVAYMSIGEAESYRFYWNSTWNDGGPNDPDAPPWLGPENPDFAGNYKVRYWQPAWQQIIFGVQSGPSESYLDRILDQGFDGVYLDIIDAFTFWFEQGERSRLQARNDMVAFVQGLAQHARLTRNRPDFLVFPQNGEDLIVDDSEQLDMLGLAYLDTIDGIGVEDVFYDELTLNPAPDITFRTGLLQSYLQAGGDRRIVISVDYVWDPTNPTAPANVNRHNDYKSKATNAGYLPYAALRDRNLDEILNVPASGGFTPAQPLPGGGGLIFYDGFETGDTSGWGVVVP